MRPSPLVGLPCDRKQIGHHPFQAVGEKYVRAVVDGAGCLPVLLPSLAPPLEHAALLDRLDGLLLTGAPSNIEPHHYGTEPSYEGNLLDPARDANTLELVRLAIERGLPVLAICRGFQEVNVALGGTLHQKVHEIIGFNDHRENKDDPLGVQYAPSHPVELTEGGWLHRIAGTREVMVNSLHGQGLRQLAPGLVVEAIAPDGLVEAVRLDRGRPDAPDPFLLAVQWHPEWRVTENPFYLGIFQAFAAACRQRAQQRQ
ncbi:gamma-glutamyl-gamma-aminobutyrate hydrolase family protein [Arenimonas sp.]|uniref:gamma-glutamyl-gamma-aminobutyrate hydrolase family protein n=1 Tax=Arenimonas sp. TaxID=1872635 RepID=UPI0025EFCCF7|nr:gamma-glutamyl-gamma-aminobutyrate hydrolase family protein [Arenimonas sp.]